MQENVEGVLPSQEIKKLINVKNIKSLDREINVTQIQPSSLDLTLSDKAWRIGASFLPGKNCKVEQILSDVAMYEVGLGRTTVFEKGCLYLVKLNETLNLDSETYGSANAKSSSGRIDLFIRLLSDYSDEFDNIKTGYSGNLYAEIQPKSFSVGVKEGLSLNQIRFKKGDVKLQDSELFELQNLYSLVDTNPDINDGLGFSISLQSFDSDVVGYKARANAPVINLSKIGYYETLDYWEEIRTDNASLILNPNDFYILNSRESVKIPSGYAAEMLPYLAKIGEFRVHYAGFFDPGFGAEKECISKAVLEVRCHEAPFRLEHGQPVGRLIFEKMLCEPEIIYGSGINSNYQGQKLKLSKHFND